MFVKTVRTFKSIAPSSAWKAVFPNFKLLDLGGRKFASARPKEDPSFVNQHVISNASRAHLTARCPFSLKGVTMEEERPMPQHEPNPFAFMTPLRAVKPLTWQVQQEILNGSTAKDPREIWDPTSAVNRESLTQRLVDLMKQDKNFFGDCEDLTSKCSRNISQDMPSRNFRVEERSSARDLGPPETRKPYIQAEAQLPLRPTPSATFVLSSRYVNKSPSRSNLQEAPKSNMTRPAYVSPSTTSSFQKRQKQSIINNNHVANKPKHLHPINVVRPDIPPLNITLQLSGKVLRLQKARDFQVELSEKEHKSRAANCVTWIKRKMF